MSVWTWTLVAWATAGPPQGVAGIEWRPGLRASLAGTDDDGFVVPTVQAYGGWNRGRLSVLGSLGLAGFATTLAAGDVVRRDQVGVIRPEVGVRYAFVAERPLRPGLFAMLALHVDVPVVGTQSATLTPEEEEVAAVGAAADRARLGRVGGRTGVGVALPLLPSLALGAQIAVDIERTWFDATEPEVSTWSFTTDASLLLEFRIPIRSEGDAAR